MEYFHGGGQVDISVEFTYTYDPIDADGDGVPDLLDAYPNISLGGRLDTDGDGILNDCDAVCISLGMTADLDDDGDAEIDTNDNCPLTVNPLQADIDLDLTGDLCDNCPVDSNANQADEDADGIGNACDPDYVPPVGC